mmetsp:Transcript_23880/g.51735  ORF Transcript_23880/g.51735 Transcript_23880/m.51735 type:complete len:271 (+) Transcript_23880:116-928(+)
MLDADHRHGGLCIFPTFQLRMVSDRAYGLCRCLLFRLCPLSDAAYLLHAVSAGVHRGPAHPVVPSATGATCARASQRRALRHYPARPPAEPGLPPTPTGPVHHTAHSRGGCDGGAPVQRRVDAPPHVGTLHRPHKGPWHSHVDGTARTAGATPPCTGSCSGSRWSVRPPQTAPRFSSSRFSRRGRSRRHPVVALSGTCLMRTYRRQWRRPPPRRRRHPRLVHSRGQRPLPVPPQPLHHTRWAESPRGANQGVCDRQGGEGGSGCPPPALA